MAGGMTTMEKMTDREFRDKWVHALRTTKRKQGEGVLKERVINPDTERAEIRYCCLGIACEIDDRVKLTWIDGEACWGAQLRNGDHGESSYTVLPSDYADTIGLSRSAMNRLTDMNDSGTSFPEIADWIEENL